MGRNKHEKSKPYPQKVYAPLGETSIRLSPFSLPRKSGREGQPSSLMVLWTVRISPSSQGHGWAQTAFLI